MFSKILVCSDGSAHAMKAAQQAAEIARKFSAEVVVTNVLAPLSMFAPYVIAVETAPDMREILAEEEEEQRNTLAGVEKLFHDERIPVRARAETGHAVDVITRVADEEKVDLIVVGSRGMGGFGRLLLGSVSDGVAHHAHCPVLIVR